MCRSGHQNGEILTEANYLITETQGSAKESCVFLFLRVSSHAGLLLANPGIDESHFFQLLTVVDVTAVDDHIAGHELADDIP